MNIVIIVAIIITILIITRRLLIKIITVLVRPYFERVARIAEEESINIIKSTTTHTNINNMTETEIKTYFDQNVFLSKESARNWHPFQTKDGAWVNYLYIPGMPTILALGRNYFANKDTGELMHFNEKEISAKHGGAYYMPDEVNAILDRIDEEEVKYKKNMPNGLANYIKHIEGQ